MERRLYRSQRHRVFLGVCGGFGDYFNIDPVIIRVIAVLLTIASGFFPGVLAYLILALIIPAEGSVTDGENAIKANIADMRDTSARLGEDVRARFSGQEGGTGEQGQPDRRSNTVLYILGILLIAAGVFFLLNITLSWLWKYTWPAMLIQPG